MQRQEVLQTVARIQWHGSTLAASGTFFPSLPLPCLLPPLMPCKDRCEILLRVLLVRRRPTSRRLNSPNIRNKTCLFLFIYLFCFISKMLPSPRQHCVGRGQRKCKIAFHLFNCLRKKQKKNKMRCYLMKSNESEKHYSPRRASARRMSEQPSSCLHRQSCFLLS